MGTEQDVKTAEALVERSSLQTKLTLAIGAIGLLMTLVNFFLTREITSTANKIDATNQTLTKLSETVSIQQVKADYQSERVGKLEQARDEATAARRSIEQRLNSLEQRAALVDQYMQTNKYK